MALLRKFQIVIRFALIGKLHEICCRQVLGITRAATFEDIQFAYQKLASRHICSLMCHSEFPRYDVEVLALEAAPCGALFVLADLALCIVLSSRDQSGGWDY